MAKAEPRPASTDELRVFAQLLEGRKTAVAGAVVMSMLSAVATLMLPLQVRDLVIALGQDERPIRPMLAMAGLALGAGLASAIGSFLLARAGEALVSEARFRIAAHILTLPLRRVRREGAGKTTLLGLTERFLLPDSGRISICGFPVEEWPLHQLRGQISYVDQSFTLVEGTVRQNLQLGQDTDVPDTELWRALETLGLRAAVEALPNGLDTELGRAEDLSGGQRQRLAAARVLLRETRVVLFDEPTSQLDSENEERLRALMRELAAERAVIAVAHRISTVQDADLIVVVDEGHIVDRGTHEELLTRSALYQELVHGQTLRDGKDKGGKGGKDSQDSGKRQATTTSTTVTAPPKDPAPAPETAPARAGGCRRPGGQRDVRVRLRRSHRGCARRVPRRRGGRGDPQLRWCALHRGPGGRAPGRAGDRRGGPATGRPWLTGRTLRRTLRRSPRRYGPRGPPGR
ncbi:ATP-binding cassette domain-containing protein [Streptomyces sp. NPDC051217]|uniref:ATP-binding cassette domain-containing protein n=1 Tax=Streptomyces sp. NPDC051217 TaxID=3365644 RepID=UPI003797555F